MSNRIILSTNNEYVDEINKFSGDIFTYHCFDESIDQTEKIM